MKRYKEEDINPYLAAANNEIDIIQSWITRAAQEKKDVNALGAYRQTALHDAASYGHIEIVDMLIKAGARIDIQDEDGNLPLHLAVLSGQSELIEILSSKVLSEAESVSYINQPNFSGNTPLHLAIIERNNLIKILPRGEDGYKELITKLNELGSDITIKNDDGQSPLHLAVEYDDVELVKSWLSEDELHKNDLLTQNAEGDTALHLAVRNSKSSLFYELVTHEALLNIQNNQGRTALHEAALKGHFNFFHSLLKNGSDINIKDFNGASLIHFIAYSGNNKLFDSMGLNENYLKEHINDLDDYGNNVFHYLAIGSKNSSVEEQTKTAERFYRSGGDSLILQKNKDEHTVYDKLIEHNDWQKNMPIKKEKDGWIWYGKTYLWGIKYEISNTDFVSLAIKNNNLNLFIDFAPVGVNTENFLFRAAKQGNLDIFRDILEKNQLKIGHIEILNAAIESGNLQLVKYIFQNSDFNILTEGSSGQTPIHIAAEHGHLHIIRYFLQGPKIKKEQDSAFTIDNYKIRIDYDSKDKEVLRVNGENIKQTEYYYVNGLKYIVTHPKILTGERQIQPKHKNGSLYWQINKHKVTVEDKCIKVDGVRHDPNTLTNTHSIYLIDGQLYKVMHPSITAEKINLNNCKDNDGNTPLHIAAGNNNIEVALYLMDRGADIVDLNSGEMNVLCWAANCGHFDLFVALLEKYDQQCQDEYKTHENQKEGSTEEEIIKLDNDINNLKERHAKQRKDLIKWRQDEALLNLVVTSNNLDFIKYLIHELNVDISEAGIIGGRPLNQAILKEVSSEIIWYLIQHGAKLPTMHDELSNKIVCIKDAQLRNFFIDKYNLNVLNTQDALDTSEPIIEFPIDNSVNSPHSTALTAGAIRFELFRATKNTNIQKVLEILSIDEKYIYLENEDGQNIMHVAAGAAFVSFIEKILKQYNYNLTTENGEHENITNIAAKTGQLGLLKTLEDYNNRGEIVIDLINHQNSKGQTLLHSAAMGRQHVIAEYLTGQGANPDIQDSTLKTPVHYSITYAENNNYSLFYYLLSFSKNIDPTILHAAVAADNKELILYLVKDKGININAQDSDGLTPLYIAIQNGNFELAKFLIYTDTYNNSDGTITKYSSAPILIEQPPLYLVLKTADAELRKYLISESDDGIYDNQGAFSSNMARSYLKFKRSSTMVNDIKREQKSSEKISFIIKNSEGDELLKYEIVESNEENITDVYFSLQRGDYELEKYSITNMPCGNSIEESKPLNLSINGENQRGGCQELFSGSIQDVTGVQNDSGNLNKLIEQMVVLCGRRGADNLTHTIVKKIDENGKTNEYLIIEDYTRSALHIAAEQGNLDLIIKILTKNDVDISAVLDSSGNTMLHVATSGANDQEVIRYLIDKCPGIVHIQNKVGMSALHMAVGKLNIDTVKLLIDSGIDINMQLEGDGFTGLDFAILRASSRKGTEVENLAKQIIILLLSQDNIGGSFTSDALLTSLINYGNFEIVKFFITRGLDINSNKTSNILHAACKNGDLTIVKLLIKAGIDINFTNNTQTFKSTNASNLVEITKLLFWATIADKIVYGLQYDSQDYNGTLDDNAINIINARIAAKLIKYGLPKEYNTMEEYCEAFKNSNIQLSDAVVTIDNLCNKGKVAVEQFKGLLDNSYLDLSDNHKLIQFLRTNDGDNEKLREAIKNAITNLAINVTDRDIFESVKELITAFPELGNKFRFTQTFTEKLRKIFSLEQNQDQENPDSSGVEAVQDSNSEVYITPASGQVFTISRGAEDFNQENQEIGTEMYNYNLSGSSSDEVSDDVNGT